MVLQRRRRAVDVGRLSPHHRPKLSKVSRLLYTRHLKLYHVHQIEAQNQVTRQSFTLSSLFILCFSVSLSLVLASLDAGNLNGLVQ